MRNLQNYFSSGVSEAQPIGPEPPLDLAQANRVVQASLGKLADEPDLETFLGHLLRVCADRFGAPEAGIWRYENGLFRLFVSYEDGEIKSQEAIGHPGASLAVARKIRNQQVLSRLRKREMISDYPEDFAAQPVYEHFRGYFQRRGIQAAHKIPLFLGDDLRGILVMRFTHRRRFNSAETELAVALGNQAVLALELTRLAEAAQSAAIVEERNRMARDIHDTLAQTFTSILMRLQTASLALSDPIAAPAAPAEAQAALTNIDRACELAREGLANTRRSVQALRPPDLMGRSLPAALADCLQQMTGGTSLDSQFCLAGQPFALPEATELELFRIAQEAITNSCKHAQARTISVQLTYQANALRLLVADDGIGFTPTEAAASKGFGLVSMQQRADRIGGRLTLGSGAQAPAAEGNRPPPTPEGEGSPGTQVCIVLNVSQS
ncbi:GAF domain-containing sensor histidine kinase [Nodosilinea nodulosa]|uniref:GAF domain-containing sensor histidine kinase n=1 Tax=Nodosilinea nodulosa TaxID=416001 RepID=UPI00037439C4|nr:GAF domain-containing sensor histidine kinase [Nodosilinea nodulosa]